VTSSKGSLISKWVPDLSGGRGFVTTLIGSLEVAISSGILREGDILPTPSRKPFRLLIRLVLKFARRTRDFTTTLLQRRWREIFNHPFLTLLTVWRRRCQFR
jgi:hypothetical protein